MKQSYHTDLSIRFKLGLLNKKEKKNIPKSTLYSWNKRDFSKVVGCNDIFSDEKIEIVKTFLSNQTLRKAAKGLFFIYSTWISITANIRGMKSLLRKNMETIVKTIERAIPLMGLKHACKLFKISQNQFYAWKNRVYCDNSPLKQCTKQSLLNMSPSELTTLKKFVLDEQFKNYSLATIYYEMMRKEKAFMSLTTFYKYAGFFIDGTYCRKFKIKPKTGIRAAKPKEIIHADVCVYRPSDYTKCFIYFIVDNFSRMILGWKISMEYKSAIMLDNLRDVYSKYLLENEDPSTALIVDDGIENKGFVCKAIESNEIKIKRLVAQKEILFSNSMVEAVNKRMKYDFLFRNQLPDIEHTKRFLETAVLQYNNRPHTALYGFTPHEVFNGAKPDKNFFKPRLEQAKIYRKAENKTLVCDNCAFLPENQV